MFDDCLYFNLVALTRRMGKVWCREFGRLGLSPSHGYLLFAIVERGHPTQRSLAELLELDASTINRFVDALEKRDLVARGGRGKTGFVEATAAGRREHRRIERTMDRLYGEMRGCFGPRKFDSLVADLQAARGTLRSHDS